MIIFPAIDLKQGKCVRLEKGDMEKATIFNDSPLAQAQFFYDAGFSWLHLIDLDGTTGSGDNKKIITEILEWGKLKVQIGGGVRNFKQIDDWLALGATRVILGTLALSQPEIAIRAARQFPQKIIIALDVVENKVAIQGWKKISDENINDAVKRVSDWGVAAILFTDILRDGMGDGINIDATIKLSQQTKTPIIASGGLKDIKDIEKLIEENKNNRGEIEGVIAGRALYNSALDIQAALDLIKEGNKNA